MKFILVAFVLVSTASLSSEQKGLIRHIEERLLAPCCYRQSIALHGSDIAEQMREEVTEMVTKGQSEEEIVEHFRSLYGDRILAVPDGMTGKVLFYFPTAALAGALLVRILVAPRMLRPGGTQFSAAAEAAPPAIDRSLQEKIDRETGDEF